MDHELQIAALQSREPVEALRARLTEDGGLARIREQLRREKTADVMYERLPGVDEVRYGRLRCRSVSTGSAWQSGNSGAAALTGERERVLNGIGSHGG